MYCMKCGRPLEDDAQFCAQCGTPVDAEQSGQDENQKKVASNSFLGPKSPEKRREEKNKGIAALVLLVVGFLVFLIKEIFK